MPFRLRLRETERRTNMSQKVIVIGGGYAGVEAAKSLDKNFDVTLVAGREVFTHIVAGLRSIVLPETTPRMQVPYDKLLKRGTVKRCLATKINADESTVTIASGETLPYDFLVLATGILHPKTGGITVGRVVIPFFVFFFLFLFSFYIIFSSFPDASPEVLSEWCSKEVYPSLQHF